MELARREGTLRDGGHEVRTGRGGGTAAGRKRRAASLAAEEHLLTGPLEPTGGGYAVARSPGSSCGGPTHLYGPGDNFDLESSHVLPALIRKFHEAKVARAPEVTVWGTGTPRREFLHVDDLADALVFMMENYSGEEIVNVGTGEDLTIRELCEMVREAVGYEGALVFDESMPDGTPRKLLDVSRLRGMGWRPGIGLEEGIAGTYRWFREN
jgi:GDP-L-fucose synthase